jgi:hypothetical protein
VGTNGTFPGFSAMETPSYLPAPLSAGFLSSLQELFPRFLPTQGLRLGLHFFAALRLLLFGATIPLSLAVRLKNGYVRPVHESNVTTRRGAGGVLVCVPSVRLSIHPSSNR